MNKPPLYERTLWKLFFFSLNKLKTINCTCIYRSIGYTCNRHTTKFHFINSDLEIIYTDLTKKSNHTREELVEMLETVRREEKEMNWKVPEPK